MVHKSPDLGIDLGEPSQRPVPVLRVHHTQFAYVGEADPSAPGGIAAIYKDLAADQARTAKVVRDVTEALVGPELPGADANGLATLSSSPTPYATVVLRGGMHPPGTWKGDEQTPYNVAAPVTMSFASSPRCPRRIAKATAVPGGT